MAAYLPTFRRQTRPIVAPVEQPDATGHSPTDGNADGRWEPSTSILIFPSPSSSIPPTPASSNGPLPHSLGSASMSNFSLPTSISVDSNLESSSEKSAASSYRRIRLRKQEQPAPGCAMEERPPQRSIPHKLEVDLESVSENTGDGELEVEVWEWSRSSSQEASPLVRGEEASPRNQFLRSLQMAHYPGGEAMEISWPPHLRHRTISQFTQISNVSNVSQMTYISQSTTPSSSQSSPSTPLYFPFISLLKQLLGIDSETIMLLGALGQSSGAEADLFLTSPFDHSETIRKTVSNTEEPRNSYISQPSTDSSIIAYLTRYKTDSSPSASTDSVKAGIRATAECQADTEEGIAPWSILLSFPPGPSINIQDLLLSPVKLTSTIASGAVNATTGIIGHSSNAVGSALSALGRPVVSVVDAVGWRRTEAAPAST
jgi:hypothetical protein